MTTASTAAIDNPLATSTWSDCAEPGSIATADDFIARAERDGHWPVAVREARVQALDKKDEAISALSVPGATAIVGEYASGTCKVLGINGKRYSATSAEQWRQLVQAAVAAGATPVGSHAWDGKVLAQFDIGGNGLRTHLVLGDSFDGSCKLVAGLVMIRMACANALHSAMRKNDAGTDWTKIRHTASLEERANRLAAGIAQAAASGQQVQELFDRASRVHLPTGAAKIAFDRLFPPMKKDLEATPKQTARAETRADNARAAARIAASMSCNRVGRPGNLATLWNAATYLVDRTETGARRECRGGASMVDSMLFGTRGKRVEEVKHLVEVILTDGNVEEMTLQQASTAGAVDGAAIVNQMLS